MSAAGRMAGAKSFLLLATNFYRPPVTADLEHPCVVHVGGTEYQVGYLLFGDFDAALEAGGVHKHQPDPSSAEGELWLVHSGIHGTTLVAALGFGGLAIPTQYELGQAGVEVVNMRFPQSKPEHWRRGGGLFETVGRLDAPIVRCAEAGHEPDGGAPGPAVASTRDWPHVPGCRSG